MLTESIEILLSTKISTLPIELNEELLKTKLFYSPWNTIWLTSLIWSYSIITSLWSVFIIWLTFVIFEVAKLIFVCSLLIKVLKLSKFECVILILDFWSLIKVLKLSKFECVILILDFWSLIKVLKLSKFESEIMMFDYWPLIKTTEVLEEFMFVMLILTYIRSEQSCVQLQGMIQIKTPS